jgi:hypothetical protein
MRQLRMRDSGQTGSFWHRAAKEIFLVAVIVPLRCITGFRPTTREASWSLRGYSRVCRRMVDQLKLVAAKPQLS